MPYRFSRAFCFFGVSGEEVCLCVREGGETFVCCAEIMISAPAAFGQLKMGRWKQGGTIVRCVEIGIERDSQEGTLENVPLEPLYFPLRINPTTETDQTLDFVERETLTNQDVYTPGR